MKRFEKAYDLSKPLPLAFLILRTAAVCLATVTSFCVVQDGKAVPFNYDELVSGDLATAGFPMPVFAFDIGVNTVSGRFGNSGSTSDFDSFAFNVPGGVELVAGQVVLADFVGNIGASTWWLYGGSADYAGGTYIQSLQPSSPGADTIVSVPLGPNVYNISHFVFFSDGIIPEFADYTFSFELAPIIPEPASAVLLLMGGGLLLGWRLRVRARGPML
jgi:hypothetical protein